MAYDLEDGFEAIEDLSARVEQITESLGCAATVETVADFRGNLKQALADAKKLVTEIQSTIDDAKEEGSAALSTVRPASRPLKCQRCLAGDYAPLSHSCARQILADGAGDLADALEALLKWPLGLAGHAAAREVARAALRKAGR